MVKRKIRVSRERQVNTYAELWHASHVMLYKAKETTGGSFHQFMASLIFTAFMMEAYLNHIGPRIFRCWGDLERLHPLSKLNLVAEKLGVEKDEGKRPYQTLSKLFKFRNSLAHGKSESPKDNEIRLCAEPFDEFKNEFLETEWEKYCTQDNAKRALEDSETIIKDIHEHANVTDDYLFSFGIKGNLSTLLPEE